MASSQQELLSDWFVHKSVPYELIQRNFGEVLFTKINDKFMTEIRACSINNIEFGNSKID